MSGKKKERTRTRARESIRCKTRQRPRILVVHDDNDIRALSTEVLIRSGYEVEAAADGAAAWQALNAEHFDLLVTDHEMPSVSGLALLKKLRAARMALPVIVATATYQRTEFTRDPWLQPAAALLMPYTVEEFLGTVREVLHAPERASP